MEVCKSLRDDFFFPFVYRFGICSKNAIYSGNCAVIKKKPGGTVETILFKNTHKVVIKFKEQPVVLLISNIKSVEINHNHC